MVPSALQGQNSFYVHNLSIKVLGRENLKRCGDAKIIAATLPQKGTPKQRHFNSISPEAGVGDTLCPSGRLPPNIQIFSIDHLDLSTRHGSTAWQWEESTAETHPKFTFHHLPFSSTIIMPFIAPGTFAFLSKEYGEFSAGEFDPNKAYDPNSLAELSQWRKEFLDGRYGSKQPTPPFTPRASSPSFPIPVIVGNRPQEENWRQMFPGDDGYESEDDEILLPPPPIPPQIAPPPPNVPAVGVQPMHDGQQRLPLRDLPPPPIPPQLGNPPPNVPAVRVPPMQQPIPLRDVPLFANPPPNVPGIRAEPIHEGQQPIPLRVLPQIFHPLPNVPAVRVQPVQQPMPLRDMPQIHHPPRNVTSIWIKLWLLFLSLWVFLQAIHVRQIQRDYAIPQFGHQPPNVPLIFDHPPAIQPRQQPLPLRDVLQFDHPLPHGQPNHPNPPGVLEVIRRLREWRGRPQDPRRPPQWMN
ncbi:hypothetical protein niasHT_015075 [Heterodera trifolii]|uniref:Uncharacterized protein n=1 Tax=Heterodera trifolii TaxID=157864 RepID=A0ABD2L9G3_9BILA